MLFIKNFLTRTHCVFYHAFCTSNFGSVEDDCGRQKITILFNVLLPEWRHLWTTPYLNCGPYLQYLLLKWQHNADIIQSGCFCQAKSMRFAGSNPYRGRGRGSPIRGGGRGSNPGRGANFSRGRGGGYHGNRRDDLPAPHRRERRSPSVSKINCT